MRTIRKTTKKATYFEGNFQLRDNTNYNWAHPIDFPTVLVAYGQGIRSGNWQSCTGINTHQYVIDNYFDKTVYKSLKSFWECVFALENITWADVTADKNKVLNLINAANNELLKMQEL